MSIRKTTLTAAALLAASAAFAADEQCSVPGMLVLEDATGDSGSTTPGGVVPLPHPSIDIVSLHMAEPASAAGKLVFTYKIAELAQVPPAVAYIVRLSTDLPPASGDEDYFVGMMPGASGPVFVHGTTAPIGAPRFFNVEGDLDPASNYAADGTITLVLDKAAIPGLDAGMSVYNILPTVRAMTPTMDTAETGTNGNNGTILDDVPGSGFYDLTGNEACEGKSGLEQVLAGALSPLFLLPLLLLGLRRRR